MIEVEHVWPDRVELTGGPALERRLDELINLSLPRSSTSSNFRFTKMAHPPASPGGTERGPLSHNHINEALLASSDGGQTLDFSHKHITDIKDDATRELARIGKEDDDDEGCVTRLVASLRSTASIGGLNNLPSLQDRFSLQRSNVVTHVFHSDITTEIPQLEIQLLCYLS